MTALTDELKRGLDAPICLTWELTYACNLACVHCLSSSGRRDPRELTTAEVMGVVDEMAAMQVFYVNIGGGEPMIRPDFYDLVDYATGSGVGVKFSTNGSRIDAAGASASRRWTTPTFRSRSTVPTPQPTTPFAETDRFATAVAAMDHLADADFDRSRSASS